MMNEEFPHRYRKPEPYRARAAGIKIQHPVPRLLLRNVAVAVDDDRDSRGFGFEIELAEIMQNVEGGRAEFDQLNLVEFPCPRGFVEVAADCRHGRDPCQPVEDLAFSDIACVNDVVRSGERADGFGPKQAMRIGDYTDPNPGSLGFQR
jgi:hypothetical protein